MKLFLIALIFLAGVLEKDPAPKEFELLVSRFERGEVLKGKMEHVFRDSFTGEQTFHSGQILLSKNKYLISVDGQIIYVDGEISRVYNAAENKVIISEYFPEEDEFAPSRFFSTPTDRFQLTVERRTDESILMLLRTADPFEIFTEVSIILSSQGIPLEVHAIDQTENTFTTAFIEADFFPASEAVFEFAYPESAEILDLRE